MNREINIQIFASFRTCTYKPTPFSKKLVGFWLWEWHRPFLPTNLQLFKTIYNFQRLTLTLTYNSILFKEVSWILTFTCIFLLITNKPFQTMWYLNSFLKIVTKVICLLIFRCSRCSLLLFLLISINKKFTYINKKVCRKFWKCVCTYRRMCEIMS